MPRVARPPLTRLGSTSRRSGSSVAVVLALVSLASPGAAWGGGGPTVWVAPALQKIRPSQPAGTPGTTAQISAARNEFEAFQIVITGMARGVSAVASDLTLQNGSFTIPGSQNATPGVHLFREATINLTNASSNDPESATGLWPDALVPDVDELLGVKRNAFPFDVRNQSLAIWCEVFVPPGAPSGNYTGKVMVSYNSGSTVTIPVALHVWGFTLPGTASLRSAYGLGYGSLPAGHKFSSSDLTTFTKIRHRYGQYALDHRVTLSHVDDGYAYSNLNYFKTHYGDLLDGTADTRLVTVASGATVHAQMTAVEYLGHEDTTTLQTWSTFFANNAASSGWPQDVLFDYTCDEPPSGCAWTDIVSRANNAHVVSPPIRALVTTDIQSANANPSSGLTAAQVLDNIVPVVNHVDDKGTSSYAGNQRSAYHTFLSTTSLYTPVGSSTPVNTGIPRQLWSYQSCMSHDCGGRSSYGTGWPSYMIDANAIRNRAMQWLLFEYAETGELYYETTYAYANASDPWTNEWFFTGNGDGTLFYPGTPAKIGGPSGSDIPVASIRLKMIREGMEDFEYLNMLTKYSTCTDPTTGVAESCAQYAASVATTVFPDMYTTNGSPDTLMSKRAEMAHVLEQLVAANGQR